MTSFIFYKFTSRNCPKTKHFKLKCRIEKCRILTRKLHFGYIFCTSKIQKSDWLTSFWWNDVFNWPWTDLESCLTNLEWSEMVLNWKLTILTSSKLPQNVKMAIFDQKYYFRRVLKYFCIFFSIFCEFLFLWRPHPKRYLFRIVINLSQKWQFLNKLWHDVKEATLFFMGNQFWELSI